MPYPDWLRETKPKRIKDLGAYLAEAIRKDYAPPAGFQSQAERAETKAVPPEVALPQLAAPPSEEELLEAKIRTWQFWAADARHPNHQIGKTNLAALEAAALAGEGP